jgi:hypothetical protein
MKKTLLLLLSVLLFQSCKEELQVANSVHISFTSDVSEAPKDGRLLLMLSNDDEKEPRFQINDGLNGQLVFGMNVDDMAPGAKITFDDSVFGYPFSSLGDVPPGEYNVQALLNVYETFNLETGQTVKLPMDNGEGQQWQRRSMLNL